jgi:Xaa-Pro aminopeptidase
MVSAWNASDKAVQSLLRPGTKVCDICRKLVDTVVENGFISPFRPGHSIGLDALDFWSITDSDERVLQPGMVLAVHASVLERPGSDACGMGYTYLITETGAERFSKIDLAKELIGE